MASAAPPEAFQPPLADPDLHERGEARALLSRLRRERPIWWSRGKDGGGFWSVLRYRDIVVVSKNPRLFSSARQWGGHRLWDENTAELYQGGVEPSLLSMDPPEHGVYRGVTAPAFTSERMRNLEARIRARATALLDALAGQQTCEFVSSVAAPLPSQVLADLIGASDEDAPRLFEWSNVFVGEDDPDLRGTDEHALQCYKDVAAYALKLWRQRLRKPGDDLVTMLSQTEVNGEVMTVQRYYAAFSLYLFAGNETVRNSISGGVLALLQHPEQRRKLVENPELIPQAVKEIIRWVSPALHMRRTATEDTELAGQRIAKGDKVVLWYLSGNFDEEVFTEPERFDVTRSGPGHLGFGHGPHFCQGARLAELELTVLLQELLPRFPDMELSGPFRRVRSNFVHGLKALPVRLAPAR
jgi:linalool 8-monooxygenase